MKIAVMKVCHGCGDGRVAIVISDLMQLRKAAWSRTNITSARLGQRPCGTGGGAT